MAGISPGHEDSAHCIFGPAREPTVAFLKKSWILMQNRRKNRARHEVFDRPIPKGRSIAFSIAFPALTITGLAVFRLADGRQNSIPRKFNLIEGTTSHHFEF